MEKKVACLSNQNKLNNLKLIFLHVAETVNFELIDNKSSIEDYKHDLGQSNSNDNDDNEGDDNAYMEIDLLIIVF